MSKKKLTREQVEWGIRHQIGQLLDSKFNELKVGQGMWVGFELEGEKIMFRLERISPHIGEVTETQPQTGAVV